ncbi:hypothetical protein F8388_003920 [Cannabis sativa]|uniref:Uncharacterized protein n=1 Tax=Cannabis sativa TaxID=3483 RepID=A0A7J6GNV1_CANSA|nr:hypothetical protein F8388_003920 [Cannabis sativa]
MSKDEIMVLVNPRTTPFKKRKFDGASSSLCPRPWKLLRPHPWAIRDFPWDTKKSDDATNAFEDEPSEDISLSNSESIGLDNWRTQGKYVISSRPMEGTFVVEDSVEEKWNRCLGQRAATGRQRAERGAAGAATFRCRCTTQEQ